MKKKLLRFKFVGASVLEIDPETIRGFTVVCPDPEFPREFALTLLTVDIEHILFEGTFDACHFKLNQIHNNLDFEITDVI